MLFMGDVHQHGSEEPGDFLRVLEAHSALRRRQVGENSSADSCRLSRCGSHFPLYRTTNALERVAAPPVFPASHGQEEALLFW